MENLKNYEFISKMDEEVGELFYQFAANLDECIYMQLKAHYPDYEKLLSERSKMSEGAYDPADYNALTCRIEDPVKIAHFLLGIKLGSIIV